VLFQVDGSEVALYIKWASRDEPVNHVPRSLGLIIGQNMTASPYHHLQRNSNSHENSLQF